jgi:hypothetical protein
VGDSVVYVGYSLTDRTRLALEWVMAAGDGGQMLVADSTAVLLSGIDLVDLGPRRLRHSASIQVMRGESCA